MLTLGTSTYSPVLRLKQGEYTAFADVRADVIPRLFPNFVIPPPKERDPELRRTLTAAELGRILIKDSVLFGNVIQTP
jgi:hypothetical protein